MIEEETNVKEVESDQWTRRPQGMPWMKHQEVKKKKREKDEARDGE